MASPSGEDNRMAVASAPETAPRVVILESSSDARVAVLDLPMAVSPGQRICHLGTSWRIVGTRTHDRVLICTPD